jgi:hypothetical protein
MTSQYYDPQNEIFGYSPNDVLYVDVPSMQCEQLAPCLPSQYTPENKKACLAQEICRNQQAISSTMRTRASNGRYIDSKNIYISQLIHMTNLLAGCILLVVVIYRYNK